MKRDFPRFIYSIQIEATDSANQIRAFNFSIPYTQAVLINGYELYSSENNRRALFAWQDLDKGAFFTDYIGRIDAILLRIQKETEALASHKNRYQDDIALSKAYEEFVRHYLLSFTPMMMRPDDYLWGKLASLGLTQEELNCVTYVDKETYYGSQPMSFYSCAIDYLTTHSTQSISQYCKKYGWLKDATAATVENYSVSDVIARIEGNGVEYYRAKIIQSQEQQKLYKTQKLAILQKYANNRDALKYIRLLDDFTYYRTKIAESSDGLFHVGKDALLTYLAEHLSLELVDFLCLSSKEVLSLLEGGELPSDLIRKRKEGNLTIWDNCVARTYFGRQVYSAYPALFQSDNADSDLSGQVACRGVVSGVVRVITKTEQMSTFQRGEILVTTMTTPNLIIVMEKAAGIITDEGGITCHATILARELGVPCIVGTRKATTLLKTGMIVNMDAVNGKITIVS